VTLLGPKLGLQFTSLSRQVLNYIFVVNLSCWVIQIHVGCN